MFTRCLQLTALLLGLGVQLPAESAAPALQATPATTPVPAAYEGDAVHVQGRLEGSTASRMSVPLLRLPASLNVIGSEDLRQRAADDWSSALRYTSGIMPLKTYGGFHSSTIRGLAENDVVVLLDGVRDDTYNLAFSSPQSNLAGIESLEVLKGPNSLLYGTGALAGVINRIRKQPSAREAYTLELGLGSFDKRSLVFGAQGPVLDGLNYRFDFGTDQSGGYRPASSRRANASLALEWQVAADDRLSLRSTVNHDRYEHPDPGIPVDPLTNAVTKNAPLDKNYGDPNDFLDFSGNYHQLEYRHGLSGPLSVALRSSYSPVDYEYLEAEGLSLAGTTVSRDYLYFTRHHRPWLTQLELSFDGELGLKQKALVGVDYNYYSSASESDSALNYSGLGLIPDIDLFSPVETAGPVVPRPDGRKTVTQVTQSVYAQDLLTIVDGLDLLAAVRYDSYTKDQGKDVLDPNTGDVVTQGYVTKTANSAVTYRTGLVVRLVEGLNAYGSYSTAFKPVIVTDSGDGKVNWAPEKGAQTEVGLKWQLFEQRFNGTLAYFDIAKTDVLVKRQNAPVVYTQDGGKTSRGFELELELRPRAGTALKGNYSYVDADMTFLNGSAQFVHGRPTAVAMHQASLWASQALRPWLSLGLGGRFVGDNYADDVTNQVLLPSYAVMDAGLYAKHDEWSLDLVASNVLDQRRYFVSSIQGNTYQLYPGEPLRVDASLRRSF